MKNIFSVKWVYFFSYIVMITPSNETLSCFHRLDFRISFWFAFPLRMGNTDEYISYSRFLNLIYLLFNHHCFFEKEIDLYVKVKALLAVRAGMWVSTSRSWTRFLPDDEPPQTVKVQWRFEVKVWHGAQGATTQSHLFVPVLL